MFLSDDDGRTMRPVAEYSKESEGLPRGELSNILVDLKGHHDQLPGMEDPELSELEMALRPGQGVMALTLETGVPIEIQEPANDPRVGPVLYSILGDHPFISVPMFAKGKPVGMLIINNYLSHRPISDRDQKLLTMLANQGGLSIETSRLYRHLEDANREMAAMRSRLLEADKLAALGEVAAGVAHEIRNPLVSIGGFTRRIRKKVGDESTITPYLDVIIEEVTRLERTLNEMLDFSTDSRSQYEEVELNSIMDRSLELLRRELEENKIKVIKNYSDDTMVYCDERQIKHVFLNLYLNAIQAMGPEGGSLTLRTFRIMRESKTFVAGEVTDTGGGISMDVIHNIFNPFFTTKDTGSGLGLSIVHKIVTRHFGQVEVHTQEGKGATMVVTLPAVEEGRAYLK
jgi:signal transduction histidine kinase